VLGCARQVGTDAFELADKETGQAIYGALAGTDSATFERVVALLGPPQELAVRFAHTSQPRNTNRTIGPHLNSNATGLSPPSVNERTGSAFHRPREGWAISYRDFVSQHL